MRERSKHRVRILLAALACMFVLSGCIRLTITADVDRSGKITSDMRLLIHPTALQMSGKNIDEIIRQLEDQYSSQYPDATAEHISETVDGTVMEGVALHNVHGDDLRAEVTENGLTVTIPVRDMINEAEKSAGVSIATLKQYGSTAVLTVNMPAPPETTLGTVSGNTVTIDLLNVPDDVTYAVITCDLSIPTVREHIDSMLRPLLVGAAALRVMKTVERFFAR